MSKVFRCKGCGEIDSIVEIQVIPASQHIFPDRASNHVPYEDVDYGSVTYYDEDAPVVGFGCTNERCIHWHGNWGYQRDSDDDAIEFARGRSLTDVAEEVDE